MKKFILAIFISLTVNLLNAQQLYLNDINGSPILSKSYTDISGSVFLSENWTLGSVTTIDGKVYKNVNLKYDTYNDVIYFKQKTNDDLFEFVDKIKSFSLISKVGDEYFVSGFPEVDKFNKDSYYQVLGEKNGNFLLKKQFKTIQETKAYNSATIEKMFVEVEVYYLFKDGKMNKFKPSKKEFLAYFPNQTEKINTYLKSNDVDFKNTTDLGKLFNFIEESN